MAISKAQINAINKKYDVQLNDMTLEDVTDDVFSELFAIDKVNDEIVANYFGSTRVEVLIKRHKLNIPLKYNINPIYEVYMSDENINQGKKDQLLKNDIESIAKGVTNFIFRESYIEELFSKITDSEMEMLNKSINNRVFYLLNSFKTNRWAELFALLSGPIYKSKCWDKPFSISDIRNEVVEYYLKSTIDEL